MFQISFRAESIMSLCSHFRKEGKLAKPKQLLHELVVIVQHTSIAPVAVSELILYLNIQKFKFQPKKCLLSLINSNNQRVPINK